MTAHTSDTEGDARGAAEASGAKTRIQTARALTEAGFGDTFVVSSEAADRALTPRRREIIQALGEHDFSSQRKLAAHLDHDPGNLNRDIDVLIEEGIVAREDKGRAMRPYLTHDTVIPEPITSSDP